MNEDTRKETLAATLDVADWRRRVLELYAIVRTMSDPEDAWHYWRRERDDLIRNHPASPLSHTERQAFTANSYYGYNPAWRLTPGIAPPEDTEALSFDLGPDQHLTLRPCARTTGLAEKTGNEITLYQMEGYGGGLFLPFRDGTSGVGTFSGGRYLLDTVKGADLGCDEEGRLVLDFNFAYYPSCAYGSRWICPLAPPENRVTATIEAGQRS